MYILVRISQQQPTIKSEQNIVMNAACCCIPFGLNGMGRESRTNVRNTSSNSLPIDFFFCISRSCFTFFVFFYFLFSFCFEERKSLLFCQGQHKRCALRLFNEMSFNLKVFIVADKSSTLILVLICLFLTRFILMKRKNPTFRISSSVAGGEWGNWISLKWITFQTDLFSKSDLKRRGILKIGSVVEVAQSHFHGFTFKSGPKSISSPSSANYFAKHQGAFWWWLLATFYAKYEWMAVAGKCAYVCEYPSG